MTGHRKSSSEGKARILTPACSDQTNRGYVNERAASDEMHSLSSTDILFYRGILRIIHG